MKNQLTQKAENEIKQLAAWFYRELKREPKPKTKQAIEQRLIEVINTLPDEVKATIVANWMARVDDTHL